MEQRLKFVGTDVSGNNQNAMTMDETSTEKAPKINAPKSVPKFNGRYPQPTEEQRERDNRSVCVTNLDPNATKEQLQQLFSTVGNVLLVTLPLTKSGVSKRYAYIELDSVEARERAVTNLNGTKLGENEISVAVKRTNIKDYNKRNDPTTKLIKTFITVLRGTRGMRGGYRGNNRGNLR
ncbi:RNA-binding protein SGN1, putative [Entamoeba dispar SAW760]|uniref:RNA-binding protein SGN1, putative n=1 Tax=Entamoeba dispar (strain ATCC PRA-260 / SAW760) TaxID=370354 RepID=B0EI41_ENTDS|nr:RNA-binding protein SGN1, putative [Entamoeba dispar SAW760]EDR25806.1 RNA-binding protein SGN1, putative [Entamoeba dispar SAW760]|eukprot:EDR25806.1 RNA-binding protein SGN1, putative [Entamoeba dispar SAW760]